MLPRVNQQPRMHQLAVPSTGWAAFSHSAPNGVQSQSISFCCAKWGPITVHFFLLPSTVLFFLILFLVLGLFSHDLPPCSLSYLINTTPTLVPYLLSHINITTQITSYPIDLATLLTTYPINLVTLLITCPINLTIVLTIYPIDLVVVHTQPPY